MIAQKKGYQAKRLFSRHDSKGNAVVTIIYVAAQIGRLGRRPAAG
jgi:hypothetical protein